MNYSIPLILIRGIPGSGKSTLAQSYVDRFKMHHWEADMFFTHDGNYHYDREKIKQAHEWCLRRTEESLLSGHATIVSNTFIRIWEVKPYLALGFPTKIIEMDAITYSNAHNVPKETIERMTNNFESLLR